MPRKKLSNPMNLDLNPRVPGKCKGKTSAGQPCKHLWVCANQLCLQHGGKTSAKDRKRILQRSQEIFAKQKAKLLKRVDRFNKRAEKRQKKWRARAGKESPLTAGSARASTSTVSRAAVGKSGSPSAPVSQGVSTTGATVSRPAPRPKPESSWHSPISPALSPKQAELKLTAISPSADSPKPRESSEPEKSKPEPCADGSRASDRAEESTSTTSGADELPADSAEPVDGSESSSPAPVEPARARVGDSIPQVLPLWHPSVVPGQAWVRHQLLEHHREQLSPLSPVCPDPRYTEPKTYRD